MVTCWPSLLVSRKRLHNYGESPFFMGKSTSKLAIFHSFLYVYWRVPHCWLYSNDIMPCQWHRLGFCPPSRPAPHRNGQIIYRKRLTNCRFNATKNGIIGVQATMSYPPVNIQFKLWKMDENGPFRVDWAIEKCQTQAQSMSGGSLLKIGVA